MGFTKINTSVKFVKNNNAPKMSNASRATAVLAFLLFVSAADSRAQVFGDWTFEEFHKGSDKMWSASTDGVGSNDKIQKRCATTIPACVWSVTLSEFRCNQGAEFVFLANSNFGAYAFRAKCFPRESGESDKILVLGETEQIDEMARAGTFAFAFPGANPRVFRTIIFSGEGSSVALRLLSEHSENKLKPSTSQQKGAKP